MENNENLFNAAVIGENPETAFIILEGNRLHAVEQSVADLKQDERDPEQLLILTRNGLNALIEFAQGKIEPHFLEIDWDELSSQDDEQAHLIRKIHNIFSHLPHHFRNELSALIHHKASS
ncbi:hypothetical protein PNK_0697 [Candidatus Protochlamydia naegleriophila]|uniref:Uncharacterized protein n=1 Tax=Candidatus Protochlamydia naegleriophila TaxID=389348 RepID=A0A0U5EQC4_9BACT|nr:hypothetical protein [Candidatus Protochlamydia naegleriophila]CUI16323.1 hypothetical protein PNK_0697 [Candidatus Protochlamydia naegleriophila]